MIKDMKVIDCHVHYALPVEPSDIIESVKASGADTCNLVLVPERKRISATVDALMVKDMTDSKFYCFSNLDCSHYFRSKKTLGKEFAKYTKSIMKCGADGIKMIEGKPTMRKVLPIPDFDKEIWDPFFSYAEINQVPILWHVNDPEEFWNIDKAPKWAINAGWLYSKSDINNIEQYNQVFNVLKRHPNIKIIFAHFFFMSKQLDKLSNLLDTYKNIMIDITPGLEMYENFSLNIDDVRNFFIKYQDRIMYGTDIGARNVLGSGDKIDKVEVESRLNVVHNFLTGSENKEIESDGHYIINRDKFTLVPLKLEKSIIEKILYTNFYNYVGEPRKVNRNRCIKEVKRIMMNVKIQSLFDKSVDKTNKDHKRVLSYFKNR